MVIESGYARWTRKSSKWHGQLQGSVFKICRAGKKAAGHGEYDGLQILLEDRIVEALW